LGRVDVLCADKTGTLTEGRLRLVRISDGREEADPDGVGPAHRAVIAAALRASPEVDPSRPAAHATDAAVLEGGAAAGVQADEGAPGWTRTAELPFDPSRGYHAVLGRTEDGGRLAVKGAPEVVLQRCTSAVG